MPPPPRHSAIHWPRIARDCCTGIFHKCDGRDAEADRQTVNLGHLTDPQQCSAVVQRSRALKVEHHARWHFAVQQSGEDIVDRH
jgi:hypothetical protein